MESVSPKSKKKGKFEDYEIEDAARTITRAEEIKADSELMKHVEKCLKKDVKAAKKAYKSISDMRAEYKEMDKEEEEE